MLLLIAKKCSGLLRGKGFLHAVCDIYRQSLAFHSLNCVALCFGKDKLSGHLSMSEVKPMFVLTHFIVAILAEMSDDPFSFLVVAI